MLSPSSCIRATRGVYNMQRQRNSIMSLNVVYMQHKVSTTSYNSRAKNLSFAYLQHKLLTPSDGACLRPQEQLAHESDSWNDHVRRGVEDCLFFPCDNLSSLWVASSSCMMFSQATEEALSCVLSGDSDSDFSPSINRPTCAVGMLLVLSVESTLTCTNSPFWAPDASRRMQALNKGTAMFTRYDLRFWTSRSSRYRAWAHGSSFCEHVYACACQNMCGVHV
jgi:hypothetical protein